MDPKPLILAATVLAVLIPASHADAQVCGLPLLPPCPTATPTPSPTPQPTPTPSPSPGPGATLLTLVPSRSRVQYGLGAQKVRLRGRLQRSGRRARVRVVVVGHAPSGGRVLHKKARTNGKGKFSLTVTPQTTADYRAAVAPGQGFKARSRSARVVLLPEVRIDNKATQKGLRIIGRMIAPIPEPGPDVKAGTAGRGHFYLRLEGEGFYRRVGQAPLGPVHCGPEECSRRTSYVERKRSILLRAERVLVCFAGKPLRDVGARATCPPRFSA
jgi:hypothetical protein